MQYVTAVCPAILRICTLPQIQTFFYHPFTMARRLYYFRDCRAQPKLIPRTHTQWPEVFVGSETVRFSGFIIEAFTKHVFYIHHQRIYYKMINWQIFLWCFSGINKPACVCNQRQLLFFPNHLRLQMVFEHHTRNWTTATLRINRHHTVFDQLPNGFTKIGASSN
jgi:hypothetical protein